MKRTALSLAAVMMLAATPALGQEIRGHGGGGGDRGDPGGPGSRGASIIDPSDLGILATTPSRIGSSRREMNRDRGTPFERPMSPRQTRLHAIDLLERADIRCEVADAMIVARTQDNIPVVEVDCVEGGGLVIADTLPIQATDCLDFFPPEGASPREAALQSCRLPGNVASVAAAREAARN